MYNKFEINRKKIKSGCQSGRKVVTHNSKSDLPLVYYFKSEKTFDLRVKDLELINFKILYPQAWRIKVFRFVWCIESHTYTVTTY